MNDQQRIETAADNCEVLRARLARYEDGEGNPVSTISEQAREIERLTQERDSQQRTCIRAMEELAALKAKPSGVVLDSVDEAASILRNMIDSIGVHGNYSQESTLLFLNQALGCLDEVARLSSSPVSAGECQQCKAEQGREQDPSATCDPCGWSTSGAGGADDRAEFQQAMNAINKTVGQWIDGKFANPYAQSAWEGWQARAALTAPNHSERVREGWQLVPVEPTPAMLDVAVSFALNVSLSGEYNWSSYMRDVWLRMLAAAPSAGSQGGDV